MSVPAPPYTSQQLGKSFLQFGGPISVSSGATTAAITFGTPFQDTSYQVAIEWVSGSIQPFGFRAKTVNYVYAGFGQVTEPSAFNWRAWRLT